VSAKQTKQEQLEALLGDRALVGLSEEQQAELAALLGGEDDESFDRAAAAVDLATAGPLEPLPAHLAAKIEADARRTLHAPQVSSRVRATKDVTRWAGWMAAAACFALAAAGWWRASLTPSMPVASMPTTPPSSAPAPVPVAPPTPTPAALREQLLAAPDAIRVDWSTTKDPAAHGASGDVVWSETRQSGFMRFHGLAANDPSKSQYQLWIFDPSQDAKTPIDGGVFDVDPKSGDVIVPIAAKLHVSGPTLFAVTVEKPGGVVVSKRERIVVTAAVKT
jgi:hypothetical protein